MSDPVTRLNAALDGRYRVERELGAGGMATVFLAADLRHHRQVALKVLKPELAAAVGSERFLSEIRTTANLQHPHILPLFDSGEADGFLFYVLPYVEGESLRSRLDRERQLPVDDAVRIATEVADALDYTHRQGVVHRDVKPANILLQDGRALVADFGIALALGVAGGERMTETGVSLGTPHYMSPEQATGDQDVGAATDTYALGCVLYEMLVGEPPHMGPSAQAVLGQIIAGDPVSARSRRASIPPNVDAAARKALETIAADRFSTTADFAKALADPAFSYGDVGAADDGSRKVSLGVWGVAALTVAAFAFGLGVGSLGSRSSSDEGERTGPVQFKIAGDYRNVQYRSVAISPGGTHVAHVTTSSPLTVRSLARSDAPVELQPGATHPFFSPDGQSIGYLLFGELLRVPITGGDPFSLAAVEDSRALGGSWGTEGTIAFATTGGLYRVPDDGGEPELLASPDSARGEQLFAWPEFLPGERALLFTIIPRGSESDAGATLAALDLESREQTILLQGGSGARYAPTGHLIYSAEGRLHAVGFDAESLELIAEPVPLPVDGLQMVRGAAADFDVSSDGTLVYVPSSAPASMRTLAWIDRQGREEPIAAPPRRYTYPDISPDGSRVAIDLSEGLQRDVYIWDFGRESLSRLTDDSGEDTFPHWSPDGQRVFFSSNRGGTFNIYSRTADGTGTAELVLDSPSTQFLVGLTPEGDRLLAAQSGADRGRDFDVVAVTLEDPAQTEILLSTNYTEWSHAISPDGDWLAYSSDASGQFEVYVGPFPNVGDQRWQISIDGGDHPLWSPAGDELFFRRPSGELMVAEVRLAPSFEVGAVTGLFPDGGPLVLGPGGRRYDVSPIDGRILLTQLVEEGDGTGIMVVLNWLDGLAERVQAP
jgi:serine/threonine-protein kinase